MAYRFFDTLLDPGGGARRTKRKLTLPVSIGIHAVVLAAVTVVPMLTFDELPEPAGDAIQAFLVEAAAPPPPPPPPPPPAAAAPRPVTAPKIQKPVPVEEPKFVAPIETPKELPKQEVVDSGLGAGAPGGEPGGVDGGVAGGTEGGVVGGTIGGVLGGQLGGVPGGVVDAPPPVAPPPPPKPTGPVRVGGNIKAPSKQRHVPPAYPPIARQARVEGTVILEATISPQGRVTGVKVLRGIPLLDGAAVDAVKQWSYSPTMLNGTPVPVVMTVTVNFRLGGHAGEPASSRAAAPAPAAAPAQEPPAAAEPPAEAPATADSVPPPSR